LGSESFASGLENAHPIVLVIVSLGQRLAWLSCCRPIRTRAGSEAPVPRDLVALEQAQDKREAGLGPEDKYPHFLLGMP
jgi:hypothetical protein